MNQDHSTTSNPSMNSELEVRLLAMLQGEASDFERDQLEMLLAARPEVASAFAELKKLHCTLVEVGAGETTQPDDEWKLPTPRREKLLAVLRGEASVADAQHPVFSAHNEHRKWLSLSKSKSKSYMSLVSLASIVCVIGILWGLSLPALQMARESSRRTNSEWMARRDFRGGTDATWDVKEAAVEQALKSSRTFSANGRTSPPSADLDSVKLQLTETLQTEPPAPYYLNDDVQNFSAPAAGQPLQAMLSKDPNIAIDAAGVPIAGDFAVSNLPSGGSSGARHDSADGMMGVGGLGLDGRGGMPGGTGEGMMGYGAPAMAGAPRLNDESGNGGMGGYGGEMMGGGYGSSATNGEDRFVDNMLTVDEPAEQIQGSGGLAPFAPFAPPSGAAELAQSAPTPDSPAASTWASELSDSLAMDISGAKKTDGELPELLGFYSNSFRSQLQTTTPRIIISEEEGAYKDTTDSYDARNRQSDNWFGNDRGTTVEQPVERFSKPTAAAPPASPDELTSEVEMLTLNSPFFDRLAQEQAKLDDSVRVSPEKEANKLADGAPVEPADVVVLTPGRTNHAITLGELDRLARMEQSTSEGIRPDLKPNAEAAVATIKPLELESLREELAEQVAARRSVERDKTPAHGLDELSAALESFSTFSLHVSDVSFKLAWDALSQGKWPEASKVRIEEFINAFDYHDPLPTSAERVACQMEQAIHPFLMQRNMLRVSLRTAATGRSESTPLRLTLLLDNSGSMERDDRRQTLHRAFEALIQQLGAADQVTLISFANRPRLLADRIAGDQAAQLLQIIETLPSEGGTNIEAALQLAMEKATEQFDPSAQHRIVLLTDGAVNLGDANPDNLSAMVIKMRDAGIAFDAAGISARDLNDEVLEALTRQGDGRYYLLDSAEAANDGFANQIAGALRPSAKNVKVQVEFNPLRVGQYKLLGFEKHRLQTEDFRNDQVDAAEMSAAEAGVAVYQFEAKPDGGGDIGSVSVRFRDLATGQMVERTWPIPYESHPPRLEEASPSLRIAAAAALLAAKLQGQALGASVSLQTVATWIEQLPTADRTQLRVQQLQQMIQNVRQLESQHR